MPQSGGHVREPVRMCRRSCTACGHRCGLRVSGCPQWGTDRGTTDPATGGRGGADDTRESGRTRAMADATVDLATVWDQIRERLATSLSPQQNAMLNLTRPVGVFEDTAVLSAPNEFTQTVLESRMRRVLAEALSAEEDRETRDRTDDGRSAFGVRADVRPAWEDDDADAPDPRPGERDVEEWAPTDWSPPARRPA